MSANARARRGWAYPFVMLAVAGALGAACTAGSQDDIAQGTMSSALRPLGPQEIVGTIAYGQTSAPIAYTENPLYRALSFSGNAGDSVDIWVRSRSGDALAWLLAADFSNLASNDNASVGTTDSHIKFKLRDDATYYIAFREATREDATFTVSLAGSSSRCDPEQTNCGDGGTDSGGHGSDDPFDPASCQGAPMTHAEALSHFAGGASSAFLGSYRFMQRQATCNTQTGCSAFDSPEAYANGNLLLATQSNQVSVVLQDEVHGTNGGSVTDCSEWNDWNLTNAGPTGRVLYRHDETYRCASGECCAVGGIDINSTVLTNHCARWHAVVDGSPDNSGSFKRTEYALLTRF